VQYSAPETARGKSVLHAADFMLPVSLALWVVGIMRTHVAVLGAYGLLSNLPIVFYLGVILLVASAAVELSHRSPATWRLGLHAVALVVMLYGTAPLLYPEGRYSWLYKTVGVVQFVNVNGHLNYSIDIYQDWPGFFALAAWFTKVAGLSSPLAFAKWAQLFYELAALPLLYLIYDALRLSTRQRWVAILLYAGANWIGQDYFSPQATGTLLSLGIMALVMRWLYLPDRARIPVLHRLRSRWVDEPDQPIPRARPPSRRDISVVIAVVLVYTVLTFTHELSPYIVAFQLGALAVVGVLRPRWLPVVLAAIAIGYLALHWSYVNSHFGLLKALGDFFKNVAPPASKVGASPSQRVIELSSEVLSLGMWALAGVGALLRRRAGQNVLPLLLLAYSPVLVLAVQGYGNEGILRVFLFSLPWTVALASSALLPRIRRASNYATHRPRARRQGDPAVSDNTRRRLRALRAAAVLAAVVGLFFPAFFGDDTINVMPQQEVIAIGNLLSHEPAGTIYVPLNHGPFADTARYHEFPVRRIFGFDGVLNGKPATQNIASILARSALKRPASEANRPAYVIVAPTMVSYSNAYRITSASNFAMLVSSMAHSSAWTLIANTDGTLIYELVPANLPPGVRG